MNRRLRWVLVLAGFVGAFGLGVAANEISGDSIGLSAKPLRPGDSLAPRTTEERPSRTVERQP